LPWKRLEVTFSNIGGIRGPYSLRFTQGTRYITGPSWAGKTSSIKAVKAGIFGGDAKSLKSFITKGEEQASIVVTVEKDGELIKIERKIGKIKRRWSHIVSLSRMVNGKWKTEFKDEESSSADPKVLKALDIAGKAPESLFKDPLDSLYVELAGIANYIRSLSPRISLEVVGDCKKAVGKASDIAQQRELSLKELKSKEEALQEANLRIGEYEKLLSQGGLPSSTKELPDLESMLSLHGEMKDEEKTKAQVTQETNKLLSEIEARESGAPLPKLEELNEKREQLVKEKEEIEKSQRAEIERVKEEFEAKIKELEQSRDEQIKKIDAESTEKIESKQREISDVEGKIEAQKATRPLDDLKAEKKSKKSQIKSSEKQIEEIKAKLQDKLKKYPKLTIEKIIDNKERISGLRTAVQTKDETERTKQELCNELGIDRYNEKELIVAQNAKDWLSTLKDMFSELPAELDATERKRIVGLINAKLKSLLRTLGSDLDVNVDETYAMEARKVKELDLKDLSLGERGVVGASIDMSLGDQPTLFFDDAVMLDKTRCDEIGKELSRGERPVVFTWRESTPFNLTFVLKPEQTVKEYLEAIVGISKEDKTVKVTWEGNTFEASENEVKTCLSIVSKLTEFRDKDLLAEDVSLVVGMVSLGILINKAYVEPVSDDGSQFKVLKKIDPTAIFSSISGKK